MSTKAKLSEAERQARREADRAKAAAAVEALKTTEGWQSWLESRRHFHAYSFKNQLLIAMQCPRATYVAGFRAWLKLGYAVRRGERALHIWVPMAPTKQELAEWEAAGAIEKERPRTRFRLGPVFDRSQVEPLPAPAEPVDLDPPIAPVKGDELDWAVPAMVELAGELGYSVSVEPIPDHQGGLCIPEISRIALNAKNPINHRVKTLVHELGHALVRVERDVDDPEFSYSQEELVVESIAYTVCGSLGLDTAGYSIPYLASWSEQATMETIECAAVTIDRIAKRIEDYIIPREGSLKS